MLVSSSILISIFMSLILSHSRKEITDQDIEALASESADNLHSLQHLELNFER